MKNIFSDSKIFKVLFFFLFYLTLTFIFTGSAKATCGLTIGNNAISSDCTVPADDTYGCDTSSGQSSTNDCVLNLSGGTLLVSSGSGGTTRVTAGSITLNGGVIAQGSSAKEIVVGGGPNASWVTDADSDFYAANFTVYNATASGRTRFGLLKSTSAVDCNDASAAVTTAATWYQDFDSDTYGNPNVTSSSCTQPGGYVSNNSDCYDSNANAKPGQTSCYTTNRGDASYDYNCIDGQTACNSCSTDYSTTASLAKRQCVSDYCYTDPYDTYFTGYTCSGSTSTCGAGGSTCTGGKATTCDYNPNPCALYTYYNTGVTGCTVSCI